MQAGGQLSPYMSEAGEEIPFTTGGGDPVIFGRPLHSYTLDELRNLRAADTALRDRESGFGQRLLNRPSAGQGEYTGLPTAAIDRRIATLRARTEPRFAEPEALRGSERIPVPGAFGGEEGFGEQTELQRVPPVTTPTATTPPGGQQQPPPGQRPAAQPPAARPARPAASQPAPAPAAQAQGINALRPGSTEGAEPSQSNVQFTDRLSPLFERMREGRIDPAARRNEAMNMALVEAGLRIASSRNPSLAGAIGEGAAPAVQSYSQQLGQIRQDQRQDIRDELQGALAQNQNDYYRGRLSQQEFATRQQMLIERLRQDREDVRTGQREEGANARNAATIAGANRLPDAARLFEYAMGRPPRPGNQEDLATMFRLNERYDPARTTVPAENRAEIAASREAVAALSNPQLRRETRMNLMRSGTTNPTEDQITEAILGTLAAARGATAQGGAGRTAPLSPGSGGAQVYTPPGSR